MYFHDNPDSSETLELIATKLHRRAQDLEHDISDLVELGLLQEVRTISFNKQRDQELQKEISQQLTTTGSFEEQTQATTRDLTGVGLIDLLIPEGYPSGSAVLVMGDPATGKTTLIVQLAIEALRKGKDVVYATLDDFPDSIRESMRLMRFDPKIYEAEGRKKLVFIDCYSFLVGVKSKEQYSEDPQRLSDLSIIISKALSESRSPGNVFLALDSLTTLIQRSGVRPSFDFLHTLVARVRGSKASFVGSLSRKAFHPAIIAAIQDKVDGVVEMKAEDTTEGLSRFIRVPKMKGARHATAWTPYDKDPSKGLVAQPRNLL